MFNYINGQINNATDYIKNQLNYATNDTTSFVGDKIPVYGSYKNYNEKIIKIAEKIKMLNKIKKDLQKTVPEPELSRRVSLIDQRIDELNKKISKEFKAATIAATGSVISPVANAIIPGSGVAVNIGSSIAQVVFHNANAENVEEKKELPKEALKATSAEIVKAGARGAFSFLIGQ